MFLRLLAHSLTRRRSRKLLAALAIWLGVSLIISLLALSIDVHDKMNLELQSFGSNIRVEPVATSIPVRIGGNEIAATSSNAYLDESELAKLKTIFWRNNIAAISPRLWATATIDGVQAPIVGVWFDHEMPAGGNETFITGARQVYTYWEVEGAWPDAGASNEALVGVKLAQKQGIQPGDRITVMRAGERAELVVSGVIAGDEREENAVIASLDTVQRLAGLPGRVSEADIKALTTPVNALALKYRADPASLTPEEYERWACTPYADSIAADIQDTISGSVARVVRRVSETQGAVLTRIEGMMYLLGVFTLIVCGLSVTGVLTSAVLERRSEVALMQAIGAHRRSVFLLFLAESSILGLAGGFLAGLTGSLLGQWLVQAIFGGEAATHGALLILAPLVGLVIAWIGNAWPVWNTLNQDTATVLQGS